MKPALTAEEWAHRDIGFAMIHGDGKLMVGDYSAPADVSEQERHALAALALYGQPFGFTREDVHALRQSAIALETDAAAFEVDNARYVEACRSLADRIEALLPPEK